MSKAITPILAIIAVGSTAFSVVQWNARTAAEAASAERDNRLSALEQSLKDALAAAAKAKDALNSEAENVARLKKERDDAKEASKQVAAAAAGAAGVSAPTAADRSRNLISAMSWETSRRALTIPSNARR